MVYHSINERWYLYTNTMVEPCGNIMWYNHMLVPQYYRGIPWYTVYNHVVLA